MKKYLYSLIVTLMCTALFVSCDKDDDPSSSDIVGTWAHASGTVTFGKDGSYRFEDSNYYYQYETGTYSYNPKTSLLVLNIESRPGIHDTYQQTLIVQTLTSTTLVLLYTDGDVKGYYTRK